MNIARTVAGYEKAARSGIYTSNVPDSARDPRVGGNMTQAYPRRGFEAFDPRGHGVEKLRRGAPRGARRVCERRGQRPSEAALV